MIDRRSLLVTSAAAFLPHARAADVQRFALGIASGSPSASTVVLWTRLTGTELPDSVPVQWELAHDEAFTRIAAKGTEQALADDAHSVHAEPAGLDPSRGYWYRFSALGQQSTKGFTRTAPAPGDDTKTFDFAIASCQRFEHGYYAAWRDVAERPPDLVMFLGDYIYEYASPASAVRRVSGGRTTTLAHYRQRYADHKSDADLQAAHARAPWLVIWDDHEVENDYANVQGERLQPDLASQRVAAYRAWWEHVPLPKAMRPRLDVNGSALRIYGSLDWGRLARIQLLDDRQYRDPQLCPRPDRGGGSAYVNLKDCPGLADPARSLLGAEQERWLAGNWSLDRPWNLLAQQTLMARLSHTPPVEDGKAAGRYWTDGWDGYAASRTRLLQTVVDRKVPGTVVLGGDVHGNYVADLRLDFDKPASPVIASEFCGTSITSDGGRQALVDGWLPHNPHIHHARVDQRGTMRFKLDAKRLDVELRVVDDIKNPTSAVRAAQRFSVEAARPGVLKD